MNVLRRTQPPPAPRPFDIKAVEGDIEEAIRNMPPGRVEPFAEPMIFTPPKADVGKLTSEAVLASYESGAKSLEGLRDELKELLRQHDTMVREADDALREIEETIASCREQGKLFAARIASSTDMIKEIRASCDALRQKIVNPTT